MIIKKSQNKIKNQQPDGLGQAQSKIKNTHPQRVAKRNQNSKILYFGLSFCILIFGFWIFCYAQEEKVPIIVNGDTVEYSTTGKEVSATGNVIVTYKGATLTCEKITVNTETKEGVAEGNVRLEDESGVIEGSRVIYNFNTKAGTIIDADFRSRPYFGKAQKVNKISDAEFIAQRGYMSTCNFDNPHYRIKSKKIDFFPKDKVQAKDMSLFVGRTPLFYLPQYTHSLKEPLMHVQIMPGKRKDWGPYLLTAWRYSITDNMRGRIYLDYRDKLGVAEGFGLNYTTHKFGKGDYKYYYTQERARNFLQGSPAEFQRYFIRWRHKWDIDEKTNITAEYYEINDSKRAIYGSEYNFLKDYFFREYEKDTQPSTYLLAHHAFSYSSIDFLMKKRTNRWYDDNYLEKLPEIKYNLPSVKINESPFYFENSSSLANLNKKMTLHSSNADVSVNRFDTTNKFSLPTKVSFIQLKPFFASRQTFYDKDIDGGSIPPRTIFYTGADLSTKFYRIFNVKSNFLGMDINGFRHIITPTISYSYNHEPTIRSNKLRQIDDVDSITHSNAASLELSNKLQTKRKGQSIDFLDFKVSSSYTFNSKTGEAKDSGFADFLFRLKLLPYSWMRVDGDATYNHYQDYFSNANYDLNFDFEKGRSMSIGQRYQRKGGNEVTHSLNWWFNPKWKFSLYQRRNFGHDHTLRRGLREQEYTISRDLHCWIMDITYNLKRGEGETIWFIFRLKAFPEIEFGFNQSYNRPKSGSQSNP